MTYRLTSCAKEDLWRIYERGVRKFGEVQADTYYLAFFERFEQIAKQPHLYISVDYIRTGYRRSVCGSDSIYYRIADDGVIEIITILGKQDIESALSDN